MTGLERLRILIDWFKDDENVPPHQFCISAWLVRRHSACQTIGCVVGHASAGCEALRKEGLKCFDRHGKSATPLIFSADNSPVYGVSAVLEFFELTRDLTRDYSHWRDEIFKLTPFSPNYPAYGDNIPKSAVVDALEEFYEERASGGQFVTDADIDAWVKEAEEHLASVYGEDQ